MTTIRCPKCGSRDVTCSSKPHNHTCHACTYTMLPPPQGSLVVVCSHTVVDGLVVRWYANLADAEARYELGSASRNRVSTERLDLPDAVAMQMVAAHNVLRDGDLGAARTLATHHMEWDGTLTPVAGEA